MAAPGVTVYVVRVFNSDGTPYLDPIGKSLASLGISPAASGISAYGEVDRDERIASAQANGCTATWEIAPDWKTL